MRTRFDFVLKEDLTKYRRKSPSPNIRGDTVIAFPDDYVCIDLETTGLVYNKHEITEICVYSVKDGKVTDKFVSLVHPKKSIPPFITKLTGISDQMVSNAPEIETVLPEVRDMIGDEYIIGHYVLFDIKFINYAFLNSGMEAALQDSIDTRTVSKKMVRGLPNYKLSTVSDYFHVITPKHRAEADVQSAMGCFEEMKKLWRKSHES